MDKTHSTSTPMVGQSSDPRKDSFRPKEGDEKVLGDEIPTQVQYAHYCT